ncbi:MAG: 4-(cytidine 5'-diphospho)-2-C-methyl-D-erythritol kinase [Pyrinomonadaceae bacterium]
MAKRQVNAQAYPPAIAGGTDLSVRLTVSLSRNTPKRPVQVAPDPTGWGSAVASDGPRPDGWGSDVAPDTRHPAPDTLRLPAFAKINWSLQVLGKRPDGYHQIETIFQSISLHDSLTFEKRDDERIVLTCDTPGIPVDESNLVVRAAVKLRERFGVTAGANIRLEKDIPAPGGLGGGSSDAAVALIGLSRLWNLDRKTTDLADIGRELGADVPFFLTGGTASGTGLGDQIEPLEDAPTLPLLIVVPDVTVHTGAAYAALEASALTKDFQESILTVSPKSLKLGIFPRPEWRNDFEPAVLEQHSAIARARELLLRHGAEFAMLCGSGASVYGVFRDAETRDAAVEAIRSETGDRVLAAETLSRSEYELALGLRTGGLRTGIRAEPVVDPV